MKYFGDIRKINGWDLPPVDVVTGGSPCQDLSIARVSTGDRNGLAGDQSGLFMEYVRVVKEMRERSKHDGRTDEFIQPRFLVFENVTGVLNSNKRRDFQTILTEISRIANKDATVVPLPKNGGKWPKSGCLYGMGDSGSVFSIGWRVHDAQFWGATQYTDGRILFPGTPQRRKRLALVADFGGTCAGEILFERKGLHGNPAESRKPLESAAART